MNRQIGSVEVTMRSILILFLSGVLCHDWETGRCPTPAPVDNLSISKFIGVWFVIEQFDTTSTCLIFNYTKLSDTELRLVKGREIFFLNQMGIDNKNSYEATIDIPDEANAGKMRIKWLLNIAGKADYTVFDTDYTNYAGVYECQRVTPLFHRASAAILSRTPILNETYVDRVKRRMASLNLDVSEFDRIDHSSCIDPSKSDVDLHINGQTFKNFFTGARDGIMDLGSAIASGLRSVASTLNDAARFDTLKPGSEKRDEDVKKSVPEVSLELELEAELIH